MPRCRYSLEHHTFHVSSSVIAEINSTAAQGRPYLSTHCRSEPIAENCSLLTDRMTLIGLNYTR